MFELSKMFLLCLNYWKLETPTQYRQRTQKDDGTAYKVDYTRCVTERRYVLPLVLIPAMDADIEYFPRDFQMAVLLPRPPE